MTGWIEMQWSTADQHCRYLACPGGDQKGTDLERRMKALGIHLPAGLLLRDLASLGWLQPILRVKLPERFLRAWEDYPVLDFQGEFEESDLWANHLWLRSMTSSPLSRYRKEKDWFSHPLDRPDDPLRKAALENQLSSVPGVRQPRSIRHARKGQVVYPWIDFYAYWQLYELIDIVDASAISGPIFDQPKVRNVVRNLERELRERRSIARIWRERRRGEWLTRAPTFDWLSRVRTLLGADDGLPTRPWSLVRKSLHNLAGHLSLDGDQVQQETRDVLVRLHNDWNRQNRTRLRKPLLALQQDIEYAIFFWQILTGKRLDLVDPAWNFPGDRHQDNWTPLLAAYPREDLVAKLEFVADVKPYLGELNALLPEHLKLTDKRTASLISHWWSSSVPLRRFCLAFRRLHEHLQRTNEGPASLREHTPIEFLVLCALHVEKQFGLLLGRRPPIEFKTRVEEVAKRVAQKLRLPERAKFEGALGIALKDTDLRGKLTNGAPMPFNRPSDIQLSDHLSKVLVCAFSNYVMLRNYSAHHDSLDYELIYTSQGAIGVSAMVTALLSGLLTKKI